MTRDNPGEAPRSKKTWESMTVNELGDVSSLVLGGGGKLSDPSADPGEPRKTRPSG